MSAWASPQRLRVHAAYRAGSRLRAEMSREDEQHWEWVSTNALSAKAAGTPQRRSIGAGPFSGRCAEQRSREGQRGVGNKRPDKPGPGDRRPVPAQGSVFAARRRHTGGAQLKTPSTGRSPLWDWLTPANSHFHSPSKRWMMGARCTNGVPSRCSIGWS